MIKQIISKVSSSLNYSANPYLAAGYGLFTIVWGFWVLIPKQNASTLITYQAFTNYGVQYTMFLAAVLIGFWVFISPIIAKSIKDFILPMRLLSIFYTSLAIFTFVGDWTTNTWLIYAFIALYCTLYSANFKVNQDSRHYKEIINR